MGKQSLTRIQAWIQVPIPYAVAIPQGDAADSSPAGLRIPPGNPKIGPSLQKIAFFYHFVFDLIFDQTNLRKSDKSPS